MAKICIGIDIAKLTFIAAIKINGRYHSKSFNNNNAGFKDFLDWLQLFSTEKYHCCMESTGKYGNALAYFLHRHTCLVSMVNPAKIKYFMKSQLSRNKTDSVDAKLIGQYCILFRPPAWQPLPSEIEVLQALVKRLDTLNNMRLQEQNRLEDADHPIKKSIKSNISHLKKQIKAIEKTIEIHINDHLKLKKDSDLLRSIPGLGKKTTAKVLAFLSHIDQFNVQKKWLHLLVSIQSIPNQEPH